MKRFALLLALAGCTPTGEVRNQQGEEIELAYVFLAPFCLIFCNTAISTTGSDIDGGGSNTQTSSQTTSSTSGP